MASVPSIPPLLCSTPPPIEFCENDEDSGLSPTLTLEDEDDVFGEYTSRNERLTPDVTSLPLTPVQNELSSSTTSGFTEVPPTIFDEHQVEAKVPVVEAFNYTIDKQEPREKEEEEKDVIELENNNQVTVEDIPDDSDNELYAPCSKNFDETLDVNSKEFFEIQVIDDRGTIEKDEEKEEEKIAAKNDHNDDLAVDEDDNDDFAEFSTFERAAEPIREVTNLRENETSEFMFEADFSAFATTTTKNDSKDEIATPQVESVAVDEFDDDDDEFGDFAEAVVPAAAPAEYQSIPAVNLSNLNERLKSMLQIMFPIDIDVDAEPNALKEMSTLKRLDVQQKLELPPIDAAKALDYQYAGSQMRQALIKSIGIDYRNMIYGEKWNPTMPRFAANLSCNPLQPLKPQNVSQTGSDPVTTTTDVPAVDFDWNSSGLVNPLDGSKEVLQSREIETHATLQQPTDDATEQKQQQQQIQIESCNNNTNDTTTTITTTDTAFTTKTTLSTDNNIQLNNNQPEWETEQTINYNPEPPNDTESAAVWSPAQENLDVEDEVVTTSTYAGPLKETHIYTPPRGSESSLPRTLRAGYMTTPTTPINHNINLRADPIDFDYEKAAAGIIIDETVVKKEYRDVEYNPDFGHNQNNASPSGVTPTCDDDFTEFQSVPPIQPNATKPIILNSPVLQAKRTATPTIFSDEMILSPAILLPQAVPMNNNTNSNNNELNNNMKTKIEWGDTVSNINPEELARIEELFPQNSNSQKSTPTHQSTHNSPQTISAAIAQKEQIGLDEDEWSDFVSVTIPKPTPPTETFPKIKQQQTMLNNNNNDDDWSDFVSNTATQATTARLQNIPSGGAQFNSAAWQTANFYNNPLSFYQQQTTVPSMHKVQNNHNRNNINNINNNNFIPQQIHIMQDFSTAPPNMQQYQRQQQQQQSNINNNNNNNQYQVGSAKVAPSISLIPDLGFVAPAMPTHTAYVNALPKSSFSMKK